MRNNQIIISVKNLVEFVLRSGDLDSRFAGINRASEVTKLYQKIQKESGMGYETEVYLSFGVEFDGFFIIVEGRADGITTEEESRRFSSLLLLLH